MEANIKQKMLLSAETLEGIQIRGNSTVINYNHTCKPLCSSLFCGNDQVPFVKALYVLSGKLSQDPLENYLGNNAKEVGETKILTLNNAWIMLLHYGYRNLQH